MTTARNNTTRAVDALADMSQRSARTLAARVRRVRASLLVAVQAGVSAGLAWYVAHDLVGHRTPFFAPVSAVVVLAVSVGARLRRAIELVGGVALGILVGDVLIYFIGTGGWQIALVVSLAILASVFIGGSATVLSQSASSAVLVATLQPPSHGIYYARFLDSLIGGSIAVVVSAVLLPVNPLTSIKKVANPVLDVLSSEMDGIAAALRTKDVDAARSTLDRMRASEPVVARFRDALALATETASLAPTRWRSKAPLARYAEGSAHIDRAIRNGRVLARRAVSVVSDDEIIAAELFGALTLLAEAVRTLRRELDAGVEPKATRLAALAAAQLAGDAYRSGLGFSGHVVVAQIRSIAADLLRATGMDESTSVRAVRLSVGTLAT